MQKRSVKQKEATAKRLVNIRFAEERAPDRSYAQNTVASVPILGVHEKYQVIETHRNHYQECLMLSEINYLTAPEDEQLTDYKGWKSLLNSFGPDVEVSIVVYNHSVR